MEKPARTGQTPRMSNTTNTHQVTSTSAQTTLVLGATGKTGRRVVERLQARSHRVRPASRSTSPAFDWHEPATWDDAIRGTGAIYIAYHPDLAVPGATDHIEKLVERARAHGVARLVLLSGRGEEEAQRCEQIVLSSGIPSTVLRCAWFNQNFSESFLRDMVVDGTIALPVDGVREPFVDADDIADAAVAALTEDGHAGQLYELTGPELLSFSDLASQLSAATGRDIQFRQISHADFMAGLRAAGLPDGFTDLVGYLFTEVLDGRNESLADGVQRALSRPPKPFSEFAAESLSLI